MRKNNLLYLLIAFCFSACYDDMGNYSYREINTLEVEGIESLYSRDVDDSLHIVPVPCTATLHVLPMNGKSNAA